MILLIISLVIFIALVVVSFLKIKQKLMILALCVISLILCNFVNQIRAATQNHTPQVEYQATQEEDIVSGVVPTPLPLITNQTVQQKIGDLLEQQREMSSYLFKRWEANQHFLISFDNLHKNRLRTVIEFFNYRTNHISSSRNVEIYQVDYKQQGCSMKCIRKTVQVAKREHFIIFIVDNVKKTDELTSLKQGYMQMNVSVIFQTLPRFFQLHSINKFTYRFPFSNNYLPKLLEHHPSKTIQYCSQYRSFDYQFYVASLTTPLLELCTRPLPSNSASKCVKAYITQQKMKVPQGWVRKCLQQQNLEGLVFENGWVSLKKEYFWSGKINKTALVPPESQL